MKEIDQEKVDHEKIYIPSIKHGSRVYMVNEWLHLVIHLHHLSTPNQISFFTYSSDPFYERDHPEHSTTPSLISRCYAYPLHMRTCRLFS